MLVYRLSAPVTTPASAVVPSIQMAGTAESLHTTVAPFRFSLPACMPSSLDLHTSIPPNSLPETVMVPARVTSEELTWMPALAAVTVTFSRVTSLALKTLMPYSPESQPEGLLLGPETVRLRRVTPSEATRMPALC